MAKQQDFPLKYTSLEEITAESGKKYGILYSRKGDMTLFFKIENPVQKYCADTEEYERFSEIILHMTKTLGEGYILQKQDIFSRQTYEIKAPADANFLDKAYFDFFNGRKYTETTTYLSITLEVKISNLQMKFDMKKYEDFLAKGDKIENILSQNQIAYERLSTEQIRELVARYVAQDFKQGAFSFNSFKVTNTHIEMGDSRVKSYSLIDPDDVKVMSDVKTYTVAKTATVNIPVDFMAFLPEMNGMEHIIYTQTLFIPNQNKEKQRLDQKQRRHHSLPDPSNRVAEQDINDALAMLAHENKNLVWTSFNITVKTDDDNLSKFTNNLEAQLMDLGIMMVKNDYNQLELFISNAPGNATSINIDYNRFLCMDDAAVCFFYKERMKKSEITPIKSYFTDRQGIPVCIDLTGKSGKNKLTNNSNFFCLGPSGSGKSVTINEIVAQWRAQDMDIVIVDTGNSYISNNEYFGGTYITYTEDNPISMNPFKISEIEYRENFNEKKAFLLSLVSLLWLGNNAQPTKVESQILEQCIIEYYRYYFDGGNEMTESQENSLREKLYLDMKQSGKYGEIQMQNLRDRRMLESMQQMINRQENKDNKPQKSLEEQVKILTDKIEKLKSLALSTDEGEAKNAQIGIQKLSKKLRRLKKKTEEYAAEQDEEIRDLMRQDADREIEKMKKNMQNLRVTSLSFNTFYEFSLIRIPQILEDINKGSETINKVNFDLTAYKYLLAPFYKGGNRETTLNKETDSSLFDEKFIVFEIDNIKEDKVLFPIVTLIIMDVFIQKMRIKKGRKALIIEEAMESCHYTSYGRVYQKYV